MAEYTPGGKAKSGPRYLPLWGSIKAGRPFTLSGIDDKDLDRRTTPLPDPIRVQSRGHALDVLVERGASMYPAGPWELRTNDEGVQMLMHVEYTIRAGMWQFCTDTRADAARNQFADQRGGKD